MVIQSLSGQWLQASNAPNIVSYLYNLPLKPRRADLDLGMAILIAPDANEFKVWVAIPNELIWQAA